MAFSGVTPYLYYDDASAALAWLTDVLGFGPDVRYPGPDGRVAEADLTVGTAKVMICGRGPRDGEGAGALLVVHLDDVDAQYERLLAKGVDVKPPQDKPYGPRAIDVTDPWGYRWHFWQGEVLPPAGHS